MKSIYGLKVSSSGQVFNSKGKKLKVYTNKSGYRYVTPVIDGEFLPKYIHRLVALTYCSKPKDISNYVVDHIDGNKKNNKYTNLEWVTPSENLKRGLKTGLIAKNVKPQFKYKQKFHKHRIKRLVYVFLSKYL